MVGIQKMFISQDLYLSYTLISSYMLYLKNPGSFRFHKAGGVKNGGIRIIIRSVQNQDTTPRSSSVVNNKKCAKSRYDTSFLECRKLAVNKLVGTQVWRHSRFPNCKPRVVAMELRVQERLPKCFIQRHISQSDLTSKDLLWFCY